MNIDKVFAILILGIVACAALWIGTEGAKDIALTVVGAIGGMTVSHALTPTKATPCD